MIWGQHRLVIETGEIARQASGAVMVNLEDTVVLVTVVGAKRAQAGKDFLPLTVDYQERTYAAGKIPGGFFRREGRPSEKEILTCRLIDRPIRPLFPDGFYNEVQIVATVVSSNNEVDSDIPAMVGASAALALSGIPFSGPIGAARVGYLNGQYVLNPTATELKTSQLDLVVAGTQQAVLMVESEAKELPEDVMLGAVVFGHQQMQQVIQLINEMVDEAGEEPWDWKEPVKDESLIARITELAEKDLRAAFQMKQKGARSEAIDGIWKRVFEELKVGTEGGPDSNAVKEICFALESKIVRGQILSGDPRIDGRNTRTVRPITIRTGLLPRAHGSALFTRGETQALVAATLGTTRDEQRIDALQGEYSDRFMMHYNMPPYATGETGRVGSPKRREIGHGRLAKRALIGMLPAPEAFAYSLRVVSEITESNGSSSMASVCGGCLALMDAGVPLKAHVAGIAMGLIKEGNRFAVLSDILGKMKSALETPRTELSAYAPRMITIKIKPEKIRDVIGKGGAVIRALTEETGTSIDIADDGTVTIACVSSEGGELARRRIEEITADVEVGRVYEGTVLKLLDFGAIVSVLPGKDGLLHISQIANERVNAVADHLKEGQSVRVKVIEADEKGRLRLSMKAAAAETQQAQPQTVQ